MAEEAKVPYWTLGEYETTAYIDEWEGPYGLRKGTHKHTDDPVLMRWNGRRWVEVDAVALLVEILELADTYDKSGDAIRGYEIREIMRP